MSVGISWSDSLCLSLCVSPFLLCLSPRPGPCPQVGRTFDPATAFVVDDLKPNTEYAFRLAARSPQGLGAFTSVVRQRTLQSSRCLADPALIFWGDLGRRRWPLRIDPGGACCRGWGGRLWLVPSCFLDLRHVHGH